MFVALVIIFLLLLVAALSILLVRATKRLLQFDDIWQGILPELESYSADLARMASADLDGILVDHPEVLTFHKRNLRAKKVIESILDSVTQMTPERKKPPALPRPDME